MTQNYKRKADDNQIIELNNVGLSLTDIAQRLDVHHTTITYRLRALGIPPADTRRAFMKEIFESLSEQQQTWLMGQLVAGYSAKDFIRTLLVKEFIKRAAPVKTP